MKKKTLIITGIVSVAVLFGLLIINPFVQVPAGSRGVVLTWGAVSNKVLGEGIHFITPIAQHVRIIDVQEHKETAEASAASRDLQSVESTVALNYYLDPEKIDVLWQKIGSEYSERIIDPALQEAVKAATAKYTAEELITKREEVKDVIRQTLKERLGSSYIIVKDFSIINFSFSKAFSGAIEDKQIAIQKALTAENDLKRIKVEAEQRIAVAKGEAEAIKMQSEAANNDKYISLKALEVQKIAVEKWNGVLPTSMIPDGTLPFINLTK